MTPGGNYVVDAEGNRTPCSPAIRNVLAPEPVATKYNAATLRELFESSVAGEHPAEQHTNDVVQRAGCRSGG